MYAVAYCPVSCADRLDGFGFADSKQLSEKQRDELLVTINNNSSWLKYKTRSLTSKYLSNSMLRRQPVSLNTISYDTAIQLIQALIDDHVDIRELYIDTVGDAVRYKQRLHELFPQIDRIIVESKADSTYKIVSAASIVAKTTRDHSILNYNYIEQYDNIHTFKPSNQYGSGYVHCVC